MRTPIEDAWQRFVATLGKSLPRGQRREQMRATFFVGAAKMIEMIQTTDREQLEGLVDDVFAEIGAFSAPTRKKVR